MGLKEIGWEDVDWMNFASYEYCNEHVGCKKYIKFVD